MTMSVSTVLAAGMVGWTDGAVCQTLLSGEGSAVSVRSPVLPGTAKAIGRGELPLDDAGHCADLFRSIAAVEGAACDARKIG